MSRKRFIKTLMAQGHSRNAAQAMADVVKAERGRCSYRMAYGIITTGF